MRTPQPCAHQVRLARLLCRPPLRHPALPPLLASLCSKLGWFLPVHTAAERSRLLDSCLNARLLGSYLSSSSQDAPLSSAQV
jgi:hypothetical protein